MDPTMEASSESEVDLPQDEKEQIASTRIDPDGRWGDFFEAALLDQLEDKREWAEEEEENASVASNNDGDDEVDDYD
jgi:hypothetical protein